VAGFAAFAVVVYVVVVLLYASSGRMFAGGDTVEPGTDPVLVNLSPTTVNGVGERVTMDVGIVPPEDLIDPDGITMTQTLTVIITPVDGEQAIVYEQGSIPSTSTISVLAQGSIENWPFDRYESAVTVLAFTTVNGERQGLRTVVTITGQVHGWNFTTSVKDWPGPSSVAISEDEKVPLNQYSLTSARSGSTVAFGFLLLGLLVVMPTLVLIVAMLAYTGRRKVEATLMSWMGAMLFATIPLRTFLPGSPPIGAWIDFLIVLWVIVALVTGLAIYVAAWIRWGTAASPRSNPH
jgi:hypothetical protein